MGTRSWRGDTYFTRRHVSAYDRRQYENILHIRTLSHCQCQGTSNSQSAPTRIPTAPFFSLGSKACRAPGRVPSKWFPKNICLLEYLEMLVSRLCTSHVRYCRILIQGMHSVLPTKKTSMLSGGFITGSAMVKKAAYLLPQCVIGFPVTQ